jgi:ribosomal protein S18 acetylase RimI-like enzyme
MFKKVIILLCYNELGDYMNNYICKIATLEDMNKKWDYEIENAKEDKYNWIIWKNLHINRFQEGSIIPYYGLLDNRIICECTAVIKKDVIQNKDKLIDNETVYLMAFRTLDEYQGKGYFRELFNYMIDDLKNKGYKYATVGVEPNEKKNKSIYFKYGFTEYIKKAYEEYPDGTKVLVEFYRKTLNK